MTVTRTCGGFDRIRALFARMPGARDGLEAVALMGPSPLAPLRARGEIVTLAAPGPAASASLFGDDIAPPPVDPELAATARALGRIAVERALDSRPDLRAQAEGDAAAAHADPARVLGVPQDASAQSALAAAVQLLTIDAQTTVNLALVGLLAGRPERCAILSDALGALASFAPGNPPSLLLGRARDPSGTTTMANIRVASTGFVTGFNLAGHSFSLTRESSGGISATRDGAPVTLAMLEGARAPVSSGEVWSGGGLVFAKMAGSPRAGVSPGGRVRVLAGGAGAHGVDAIATAAPADDAAVNANVELSGRVGNRFSRDRDPRRLQRDRPDPRRELLSGARVDPRVGRRGQAHRLRPPDGPRERGELCGPCRGEGGEARGADRRHDAPSRHPGGARPRRRRSRGAARWIDRSARLDGKTPLIYRAPPGPTSR